MLRWKFNLVIALFILAEDLRAIDGVHAPDLRWVLSANRKGRAVKVSVSIELARHFTDRLLAGQVHGF